jgi:hypothetical protein
MNEVEHETVANVQDVASESDIHEAVAEIAEVIQETEAAEEKTNAAMFEQLKKDIAEEVAERTYVRMKQLVTDLLDATEDAADMAMEEGAGSATTETSSDEEKAPDHEEDVAPRRSHRLFRKVGKREE